METKSTHGLEIKAEGEGIITAYAATYNGLDSYGDTIRPGAFAKTISERKDRVKVLYNHDPYTLPVGKAIGMIEDANGLLTQTKMSRTQLGQDIYTLAQEGALTELSIGYSAVKAAYPDPTPGGPERELLELKLLEYSFVPMPADERALIVGLKSAAELEQTIAQLERFIAVDLKGDSPLAAKNLKRLQPLYQSLHALLQAKAEPSPDTPLTPEAANQEPEPQPHSDDLLTALKSFTPTIQHKSEEAAVIAELKNAFAFIHKGA